MFDEAAADTIRSALGRNKIKYSILEDIIELPHIDTIHINLNSLFSYITAKYLVKSEEVDGSYRYVIASIILNTVGHYRHYCVKHGWCPTIYMYTTNCWNEAIESALKVIEIITNYLDKIYFIKVGRYDLPCEYMKYYINQSKGKKNLILTKDVIDLQLLSDNTHVIHLNKDESIYYNPDNVYDQLAEKEMHTELSHKLVGPVMFYAGIGMKNSGVKGSGRKKTIKLFTDLIESGTLVNDRYSSYQDLVNDLSKEVTEDFTKLRENFEKYDLGTRYIKDMTSSKMKILDSYIIDKFAKKDLLELNNKYFTGFDSLLLEYLMEIPGDPKAGGPKNLKW